jgi:UDP-2,3-diacylglucosamine hydrolase
VTAWFVSDIHLKDINERSSIILLRFLRSLLSKERPATHLFLLGDIFDLWVADAPVFVRKFQAIVDAIHQLKKQGVEVIYFEGNHDLHLKTYWQDVLGIPTHVDFQVFRLGDYDVRLEHGDLINQEDKAYLRYRSVVRHTLVEKYAPVIAGEVLNHLGEFASGISRKFSSKKRSVEHDNLKQMIRSYAQAAYRETHFDLIITGHMHVRDDFEFQEDGKNVRSINLGSWYDQPMVLCLNERGPEFLALQ